MIHFRRGLIFVTALVTFLPTPTASAQSTPRGSCPELKPLIKEMGLPPIFLQIAFRESRCQSKAVGWNYRRGSSAGKCESAPFRQYLRSCRRHIQSFDSGLWQINSTWFSITKAICGKTPQDGALLNSRCNARVAKYLYENGGLGHWKASSGS